MRNSFLFCIKVFYKTIGTQEMHEKDFVSAGAIYRGGRKGVRVGPRWYNKCIVNAKCNVLLSQLLSLSVPPLHLLLMPPLLLPPAFLLPPPCLPRHARKTGSHDFMWRTITWFYVAFACIVNYPLSGVSSLKLLDRFRCGLSYCVVR